MENPVKKEGTTDNDCVLTSVSKLPSANKEYVKQVISLDSDDDDDVAVKHENDQGQKDIKAEDIGITTDQFVNSIVVNMDPSEHEEDDINDQDFIHDANSDSDSDSDDPDESETKGKRNKLSKNRSATSVAKGLRIMENLRKDLIIKQYEGDKLSPRECEDLARLEVCIAKAKRALEQNPVDSPPKGSREFWTRQLKRRGGEKRNEKRKSDNDAGADPKKVQKTDQSGFSSAAALFTFNTNQTDDSRNTGSEMNQIKATTHASQIEQIMAAMPEECDTRHTKTQKKDLIEAKSSFGYKKVKAVDGDWQLKGMKTPLHSPQLVAASWMTMKEAIGCHPAGGILADDMGLGKTITTLATIIGHPPEPEDKKEWCNATLIIADGHHSAEETWMKQIQEHAGDKVANKSIVYTKDLKKRIKFLRTKTIVVTDLNELRSQFPSKNAYKLLKAQWAGDAAGFQQALRCLLGPLFKINWYRIILDEAHEIRNLNSNGALAAFELRAKYRWALSGTPLTNKLDEFFPLLKFIGFKFATSMRVFRAQYVHADNAAENFEHLVSFVMMRRKQTDKFLGNTMVPLPKSHRKDIWVPLSTPEKILNQVVDYTYTTKLVDESDAAPQSDDTHVDHQLHGCVSDEESEAEFETDGNFGSTVPNSYRVLSLRRMRLLQSTSHPLNLEKFFRKNDREESLQEDNREELIQSILEQFKCKVTQGSVHADQKAFKAALNLETDYSSGLQQLVLATKDRFGGIENMAKLLTLVANERKVKNITCGLCRKQKPPVNPVYSLNCEHIYCKSCLDMALSGKTKAGRPRVAPMCRVPGCSVKLAMGNDVKTPACIDAAVKAIRGYKEPGRDDIGTKWRDHPDDPISFFRAVCGRDEIGYGPVKFPVSSKLKATVAVALTWMKEAPDDKMIIYIRWTRTARALGCVLESMGIKFLYINRMATKKQKHRALEGFASNPEIKILVASMKCGGQSFNLQMANRCIIVDQWWNLAAEEQAFRRVFRTGQNKETHLVRIIGQDTIDERIVALQKAKEIIINAALQDGDFEPRFPADLQLRMLFSSKDGEALVSEMMKETRAQKN